MACHSAGFLPCHLTVLSKFCPLYFQDISWMFSIFQTLIPPRHFPSLNAGPPLTFPSRVKANVCLWEDLRDPTRHLLPPLPAKYSSLLLTTGSHADWRSCQGEAYVHLPLLLTHLHADSQFASLQPVPPVFSSQMNHLNHVTPQFKNLQ